MRTVFLGTPRFAVPTLEAMAAAGHVVSSVFTQPDRPAGRGGTVRPSPVKEAALRLGIPVHQPERVRTCQELLAGERADAMVVVGYGQIIPQSIIDLPPLGIINVHASLLPKYRGAAPIQWAIANGETRTGVTTMRIDAGLDTGDLLLAAETSIGPDEHAPALSERLAAIGAALLIETLDGLPSGRVVPRPQNPAEATLAPILRKEDGRIDWSWAAAKIHNRLRGFDPWPGVFTTFRGLSLQIHDAIPVEGDAPPGSLRVVAKRVLAGCGAGSLELREVQLQGRQRVRALDFANGARLSDNEAFGDTAP